MNIQYRLTSVNIIIESAENIQAILCFKSSLQSASNIIQQQRLVDPQLQTWLLLMPGSIVYQEKH